jgi:two-component system, cell cycle sensor histidine kinase and response regulator CckA
LFTEVKRASEIVDIDSRAPRPWDDLIAFRHQLLTYLVIDSEKWQLSLFTLILRATALLGFLVYLPSVYKALQSGLFGLAVFDTIALATIIGLIRYHRVSYRWRATIYCLLSYGLGAASLVSVGPIGQIFLFGFSITAALLLGLRAGLFSALLSSATLFTIGTLGHAAPAMLIADWHHGLLGWVAITLNFSLVNILLTLAVGAVLAALTDALQRLEARTRDLVATSERLKAILDASPVAIAGSDALGIMTVWNITAERLTGLKAADLIGHPIPDTMRDISGEFGRKVDLIKQGQIISGVEVRRRRPDGSIAENLSSAAGVFDSDGTFLGVITATMDVSVARQAQRDRDAAEAAMWESERRYRTTFDLAPVGIIHTAPDGRFLMANDFFCDLVGYTRPELLSLDLYAITDPEDIETSRLRYQQALPAGAPIVTIAKRYRHRDGGTIWAEVISTAERDENGQVRHFMSIVNDTTARHLSEKRQLQLSAQLHHAQKMEAVGRLTGGMAHDFNNLLAVMLANLDFLETKFESGSEELELTQEAISAAWRGAELIQSLLAFARRQSLAPKIINLPDVLIASAQLFRRTLGENITLDVRLNEPLWPVLIDVAQLESAILNLAINARDAMPRGGTLTIEARNVSLDDGAAELNPEVAPGDFAVISVSDTGIGMCADTLARVFEPFFTTKGTQGSGLGLSMAHGFVKQSGGHTNIYSEVGHGTTINIYLPRVTLHAVDVEEALSPAATAAGHETILVVEDNHALRSAVTRQLQKLGYHTLAVADAEAAMDVIRSDSTIDLLFTDVVMPGGMDGWALAEAGRAMRQGLKVLLTSGYTAAAAATANEFGSGLLSKPYRRDELALRVRDAIDGAAR